MDYTILLSILEIILLVAVFLYLFRFIFLNYSGRVRKPASWVQAVSRGDISIDLVKEERKFPDRIRFYNIWLQINTILKKEVPGSFAELGVYKGATARIIHLCAADRKLHLFDTFKGFPSEDLKNETGKAAGYTSRHFADTSLEKVKKYLGKHENIVFHAGYFPETTLGLEDESYAFVNIDVDLHDPTLAGLEYFYPRLSPGGIILVHDYNQDWPELMKAVDVFCLSAKIRPLMVADADSTIMIVK